MLRFLTRVLLARCFLVLACVVVLGGSVAAQSNDRDVAAFARALSAGDLAGIRQAAAVLDDRLVQGKGPEGFAASDIYYVLATSLFRLGDNARADEYFEKSGAALRRDGEWSSAKGFEIRYEHSGLLILQNRLEEAVEMSAELFSELRAQDQMETLIARQVLVNLAHGLDELGLTDEAGAAWALLEQTARAAGAQGTFHLRLALLGRASFLQLTGRPIEALKPMVEARDIALLAEEPGSEMALTAELQYAFALIEAGRTEEARTLIARLLATAEQTLPSGHRLSRQAQNALDGLSDAAGSPRRTIVASNEPQALSDGQADPLLKQLSDLEARAERIRLEVGTDDLPRYAQALRDIIQLVEKSPDLPRHRGAIAQVELASTLTLIKPGFGDAHEMLTSALKTLRAELGADDLETLRAEVMYIRLRRAEARFAEPLQAIGQRPVFSEGTPQDAELSADDLRVLATFAAAQTTPIATITASLDYANALTEAGQFNKALEVIDAQAVRLMQERLNGDGAYRAVWFQYQLAEARGRVHLAAKDYSAALAQFRDGVEDLTAMMREARWASAFGNTGSFHSFGQLYGTAYATSAWLSRVDGGTASAFEAAFEAVQLAGYGPAAASVSRASARRAAQDPVLARSIVEMETLAAALSTASGSANARETRRARLQELQSQIDAQHPDYFKLQIPAPVSLDAIIEEEKLSADQALILIAPMARAGAYENGIDGLVMAVTREGRAWASLEIPQEELLFRIAAFHDDLDPGRGSSQTRAPLTAVQTPDLPKVDFDFGGSHELYEAFFGADDIAELIEDKQHWTIVPLGAALSVPFAALVKSLPQGEVLGADGLRDVEWLGHEKALQVQPSVAVWLDLIEREAAPRVNSEWAYIGFGNPVFEGAQDIELASADDVMMRSGTGGTRAALASLPRLPGTAREVDAVAEIFGAPKAAINLGAKANETELQRLSDTGRLSEARILHFATHGLLAGAFDGLAEPALALTPPVDGGSADDGLFTASEAAQLTLNADWVILSACDTAGRTGVLGDGVGGLAQGFFAAGARALLVSHWRVDDRAAEFLTVETVRGTQTGKDKAEALRSAMKALSQDRSRDGALISYAHPTMWAPFFLVGGQ